MRNGNQRRGSGRSTERRKPIAPRAAACRASRSGSIVASANDGVYANLGRCYRLSLSVRL